jgi:SPP1 gp7 family putative phage head morphogenesis protein
MRLPRAIRFLELPQQRGLEREYARLLVAAVKDWAAQSMQIYRDALTTFRDSWINDVDRRVAELWEQKERDITEGRIGRNRRMRLLQRQLEEDVQSSQLGKLLQRSTQRTDDWWANSVKRMTGADNAVIREKMGKRQVNKLINKRMNDNIALIKDIGVKTRAQIKSEIKNGIKNKLSNEQIAANIQQRFNVSESRARVIATDQIQKHNSAVSQARMREAGSRLFIWQSQEDKRVRPLHQAYNRQKFSWERPPADGYPGEPVLCRCYAINVPAKDELYGLKIKASVLEKIGETLKEFRELIPSEN